MVAASSFMIASGVIGLVGGMQQKSAANRAANEQHEIDTENIRLEGLETDETIRRQGIRDERMEGTVKTQVGASGFKSGSSLDSYIQTLEAEHQSDIDWMRTSGASRQDLMTRDADARRSQSRDKASANFLGSIGSSFSSIGQGMSW